MLQFVLDGVVPIKKNDRRVLRMRGRRSAAPMQARMSSEAFAAAVGKAGKDKIIIAPNERYVAWEKWAIWELRRQANAMSGVKLPLKGPLNVAIVVTVTDRRRRDLLNLMAGPMDALSAAGIIEDDCWTVVPSHDGSRVVLGTKPGVALTIARVIVGGDINLTIDEEPMR